MNNKNNPIKNAGFTTPSSYFDGVEEHVLQLVKLEKNGTKALPFSIPNGYFETLEDHILANLHPIKKEHKLISLIHTKAFKYVASIAAITILFVSIFADTTMSMFDFDAIEQSQISYYVEQGYIDVSDTELEILISEQALNNNLLGLDISKEELFEYLSNSLEDNTLSIEGYQP
ncbi:MAG: hypothetical protein COZ75_09460 [Flavobacteriaceae bacterium CG_4_8_14_3_um_filter_34_10]|nr:hypothetical protein [Flavobacteriia bacterium]PIV48608.1 MAG: hypothetical protein COS19_13025 [Flavobacteriaceae bacterium CG02_land_8_20_14_3_00_34_13]PIX08924.1 MAG: hypothetical protein COZ75_09460 [Flavobacteriaceae bacterium CG_4_8_14_3_um_filter_34_10]PIZ07052.1 MAG: hypothetical protein COY56_11070 [Flavobacteriaceae bacterium CG_4_10_14_0_8_um_filter_34_31]